MRRAQEKRLLFFCLIFITGCVAGDDFIMSGQVRASVGQSVSLPCRINAKKAEIIVSLSEWTRCTDSSTIAVITVGQEPHITDRYTGRVSITQNRTLTIHQVQDGDYGDYCCKVTAFPQGSLEGRIQLQEGEEGLEEEVNRSHAGLPVMMIVYISCGVVGFVVLVIFITTLVFHKRRRKILNPVHVTVSNSITFKQPSLLQKDSYTPSHTPSHTQTHTPRCDDDDDDEVDMYLNIKNSV